MGYDMKKMFLPYMPLTVVISEKAPLDYAAIATAANADAVQENLKAAHHFEHALELLAKNSGNGTCLCFKGNSYVATDCCELSQFVLSLWHEPVRTPTMT